MTKKELLKNAYNRIKNGETLVCNGCRIWKYFDSEAKRFVLGWCYYGRSATGMNFKDFKWIVDVIAESKDYLFETPEEYSKRKNIPLYLVW
jgi:hypothetical protein